MRINVFFAAEEPVALDMADHAVVVIDVLRATSSMVEALVNGAEGVVSGCFHRRGHKARFLTRSGGHTVLCGESKGVMIEGFDLGNSPREFVAEQVAGKRLVMTTTNGTRAFLMAGDAAWVMGVLLHESRGGCARGVGCRLPRRRLRRTGQDVLARRRRLRRRSVAARMGDPGRERGVE